jgi:N-acetylneuraminic acid mutarotase
MTIPLRLAILILGSALACGQGTEVPAKNWKRLADIPKTVICTTTVVLNGKIHVLGGAASSDHQVFDPQTNAWTVRARLPAPEGIGWGMAAPFQGKIYFFGGGYGDQRQGGTAAWSYDPRADCWKTIAPLPEARLQGAAVATERAIYIIGGHRGSTQRSREEETKVALRYDPAGNRYTRVADSPESALFIVSAYYKGRIFIVPGVERTEKAAPAGYIWADGLMIYDPARDAWSKRSTHRPILTTWSVTQQSSHAVIGSRLFIGGGGAPPDRERTDVFYYYDMERDRFETAGRLPRVRCCAGAGVVGSKLYIVGGFYNKIGDKCPETWGYPFPES